MLKGENLKIDIPLVSAASILIGISLLTLSSSGGELFYRQLIWLIPAGLLLFGLPYLNLRALLSYKWVIIGSYAFGIALLIITYVFAPEINGVRSWLSFGSVQIQASEFMKAGLIIFLSNYFAKHHVSIAQLGVIFTSFLYLLVPFVLIMLQPDLGTALVLFGIWFCYLLLSEIRWKHLLSAFILLTLIIAIAWGFLFADYQKARISALFTPEADPLGINYSTIQSKIAIGSGGIFGKGFGQGSQVQLGFLPEAHTDYIFSTFAEEWGLVGALILIVAFSYMVYRVLVLGRNSSNNLNRFLALGTAVMLLIHFIINMGSATGILPVIGVGLPLVSYGGSNLLTVTMMLGIIQSIADKR